MTDHLKSALATRVKRLVMREPWDALDAPSVALENLKDIEVISLSPLDTHIRVTFHGGRGPRHFNVRFSEEL